jgi:hypothetical protein
MKISALLVLVSAMCLALLSMPANAQATRTWVSGVGDDANPCSRTAPCKTFAGAISKTANPGEINCLDPGGFGALTITTSIAIICGQAGEAGVLVAGTNGFTINAPSTAVVYLEGLDFEGLNASSPNGIQINTAAQVTIVNCRIRGFSTAGINVTPSSGAIEVNVTDTIAADNLGEGIQAKPTGSGSVRMMIDRTRSVDNTGDGMMGNANVSSGSVNIAIRDSESANNGADGYVAFSSSGRSQMMIDSSTSFNNSANGINASGSNVTVRFTRAAITGNTTGVSGAASAQSYGTNSIDGNGSQGSFTPISQE